VLVRHRGRVQGDRLLPRNVDPHRGRRREEVVRLSPWQKAATANLFGWKRLDAKEREVRRYLNLFVYVPRKNGKTPWCAGIGLYVFFCDDEAGQQGYIAAKDKDQAGKLFRQMEGMVRANELLSARCRPYGGNAPAGNSKSFVKDDNSFLKVISADASGKHGGTPNLVIVDELHEQPDRELIDTLRTSLTSENRKQPLMLELTTADFDRPSICNERYEFAKRCRRPEA
jgi:phage terminase large subunit-like protein